VTPKLRLVPGVALVPMGDAVQLRLGDERVHVLSTDPPEVARRLLDGLREGGDRATLVAAAGERHEATIDEALATLAEHDWLERPSREVGSQAKPTLGVAGHEPSASLFLSIAGEQGMLAAPWRAGIPEAAGSRAMVCVCERLDLALAHAVNDAACEERVPCLFVDLSHGRHATIGPFFVPGEGACYRCMRARLRENTMAYAELVAAEEHALYSGKALPAPPVGAGHRHWALGMAAVELAAWSEERPLRTLNRAITVDFASLEAWSEPVWRIPWCRSCGSRPT
jgi:bacteriocin biosynthesis cyclodehydratase domain-containing protein